MRNLLIVLLSVLFILLGVVVYKHFKNSGEKSTTTSTTAVPLLTSNTDQKQAATPVDAPANKQDKKEAVEASSAKQESKPAESDARVKTADQTLASGDKEKAIRQYAVILEEYASKPNPWANTDLEALRAKHAGAVRDLLFNPAGEWKSTKYKVVAGDSFEKIRKKVLDANHKPITVGMIRKANRIDKDTIHPGDMLRIPQEDMKVIVDRASYTLRVYFGDLLIGFYKVGLGKQDTPTPVGSFVVGEKQKNPTWFPKGEKPIGPSDPNNPLGTRWIALKLNGGNTGYGIHGTNKDEVVGSSISQGCVRMYNKDVEELSEILPETSIVEIR